MPSTAITTQALDTILAWQFTIAWAGEGLGDLNRLKWWRTDLVDEAGGGDFMQRLAPRTHRWAALEAVRHAAFLADQKARLGMANPDGVVTLYFWGFELDEKLTERIREHKGSLKNPEDVLPLPLNISPSAKFNRTELEMALQPESGYRLQPGGRELKGFAPEDFSQAARLLAGALLPLTDSYPAPHFRR